MAEKNSRLDGVILTPVFRVSFPELFKTRSFNGGAEKFSVTMLFPVGEKLTEMKAAAKAAAVEKWGKKIPETLRIPFRKTDEKPDLAGYEPGAIFVKAVANPDFPPERLDIHGQKILSAADIYAGCFARAFVACFAYDAAGNKGVSFGLRSIQKVADGEPLGGGGGTYADLYGDAPELPEGAKAAPDAEDSDPMFD